MSDGHINKRIADLEKTTARIERKINHLEAVVSTPRQDNLATVEEQNSADHKDKSTPASISTNAAPTNSHESMKPSDQPIPRWRRIWGVIVRMCKWPHWWKAIQTLGIAAAILYAAVSYEQWRDLRHNFEADQRSWIRILYAWPPSPIEQPFQMNASLTNAGKSAVTYLYAHGTLEVVDASDEPSFSIENYHSFDFVAPMFPADNTNFSISPYDQKTLSTRGFSSQELNDLHSGTKYLVVFGIVLYFDQFGPHWYRFCNWHSYGPVGSQVNAGDCSVWNLTGDGLNHMPYPDTRTFYEANKNKLPH